MASSQDEPRLGRLGDLYEEALAALQGGDFERVRELVEAAEPLLAAAPGADPGSDPEVDEQRRAVQAHRALLASLADERDETLAELMRLRRGPGALAADGHRLDPTGTGAETDP